MEYKELSKYVKNAVTNCLDVVKENIINMPDSDIIKLLLNIPKNSICCLECKYCDGKELKIPYCHLLHRDVSVTDFCSFGEKETSQ